MCVCVCVCVRACACVCVWVVEKEESSKKRMRMLSTLMQLSMHVIVLHFWKPSQDASEWMPQSYFKTFESRPLEIRFSRNVFLATAVFLSRMDKCRGWID